jgi:hypothetical protein
MQVHFRGSAVHRQLDRPVQDREKPLSPFTPESATRKRSKLTVPTIRLRVLFVFLVLEHRRREVLHFNVTEHPTSAWVAQQIVEAFADHETPRYLIRDRDGVYGNEVWSRLKQWALGRC